MPSGTCPGRAEPTKPSGSRRGSGGIVERWAGLPSVCRIVAPVMWYSFRSAASGHARPTLSKSIFATVCAEALVTFNASNAAASRKASYLMVISPFAERAHSLARSVGGHLGPAAENESGDRPTPVDVARDAGRAGTSADARDASRAASFALGKC